jgi:hypothetical protein
VARKPIDLLDPQTGEVQRGYVFWSEVKPNKLVGGFFVGFQEAFIALAQDREMTLDHHRILHFLFGKLDFDNFIHIKQKEIAEALNMDKGNVSKAMTLLKRKGIILVAPYKGVRCYKLNHFYGWKGSVTTLKKQENKPKLKLIKTD